MKIEPLSIPEEDKAFIEIMEPQKKLIVLAWGFERLPKFQPRIGPSPFEKVYEVLKTSLSTEEYNKLYLGQFHEAGLD